MVSGVRYSSNDRTQLTHNRTELTQDEKILIQKKTIDYGDAVTKYKNKSDLVASKNVASQQDTQDLVSLDKEVRATREEYLETWHDLSENVDVNGTSDCLNHCSMAAIHMDNVFNNAQETIEHIINFVNYVNY